MKYILLISTLMFSAGSWAEWTQVAEDFNGNKTYVDFDRIRKVNGLVYYWEILDYLEPFRGTLSLKYYYKADCETMRTMALSFSYYEVPMAEGNAESTFTPDPERYRWVYAQPDSVMEGTLEAVCAH